MGLVLWASGARVYHTVMALAMTIEESVSRIAVDEWEEAQTLYTPACTYNPNGWRRKDPSGHQFGIELECELRRGFDFDDYMDYKAKEMFPVWYLHSKYDGSLGPRGMELVTRPDSMAVHRKVWAEALPEVREAFRGWNGEECGMHVHIGRSTLTKLQLAKMIVFLNAPNLKKLITSIAGRDNCSWCKIYKKTYGELYSDDRYEALNVTNHSTVEVRIFRSNVSQAGFLKNLEFVECMVDYCAPYTTSACMIENLDCFLAYLSSRKADFPNLNAFVSRWKERNVCAS